MEANNNNLHSYLNWLRTKIAYLHENGHIFMVPFTDQTEFITIVLQTTAFSLFLSSFYLIGYFNFSILWVFIVCGCFAYCEIRRNGRKRRIDGHVRNHLAMNKNGRKRDSLADAISSVVIKKSFNQNIDFESTLLTMNAEKAEWMNSILSDIWPYLCMHIRGILKNQIEPMITEMQPNHILKHFTLY